MKDIVTQSIEESRLLSRNRKVIKILIIFRVNIFLKINSGIWMKLV